jgi:hypothetical protein
MKVAVCGPDADFESRVRLGELSVDDSQLRPFDSGVCR